MSWIKTDLKALQRQVDRITGASCSNCEAPLQAHAHRCGLCFTVNDATRHAGSHRYTYIPAPAPWVHAHSAFMAAYVSRPGDEQEERA